MVAAAWRTDAVLGVARTIRDTADQSFFAILGDALEEAGCASDSDRAVPRVYVCEKCGHTQHIGGGEGIYCRQCGSVFCRKQREYELPRPILGHLRGPGPHVRGCWVVDLLLGKE